MPLPLRIILIALLVLPVAEFAVFGLVAGLFGFLNALLALIAGSALGIAILARAGHKMLFRLAGTLSEQRVKTVEIRPGGLMTVFGAVLLAIPGFLTDAAGLLLLIPWIQNRIAVALSIQTDRGPDSVVDLDPEEWRQLPNPRVESRKKEHRP
jgi:UPF0716 protein FxsA